MLTIIYRMEWNGTEPNEICRCNGPYSRHFQSPNNAINSMKQNQIRKVLVNKILRWNFKTIPNVLIIIKCNFTIQTRKGTNKMDRKMGIKQKALA